MMVSLRVRGEEREEMGVKERQKAWEVKSPGRRLCASCFTVKGVGSARDAVVADPGAGEGFLRHKMRTSEKAASGVSLYGEW